MIHNIYTFRDDNIMFSFWTHNIFFNFAQTHDVYIAKDANYVCIN